MRFVFPLQTTCYSIENCSKTYSFIYTQLFENLKARILKSIITRSEMEQQTAQAKEVKRARDKIMMSVSISS